MVEAHNITATGFVITWEAPQGLFKTFTVTIKEVLSGNKDEDSAKEPDDDEPTAGTEAELHSSNRTLEPLRTPDRRSSKKSTQVLAGSARSYQFRNLLAQTRYSVSVVSSGRGLRSKIHLILLIFHTSSGPEPPTELLFSNITETSFSVSWTKPKSKVTEFKVTYTNSANGETGSMSVDSQLSHVLISKLSAGSSYEVSVRSILETTESEPTTASVTTVPNSPSYLHAVNVTDTKALLLWKPAQAKVDHYILTYGSAKCEWSSSLVFCSCGPLLPYPYPTDCSQVQLNGVKESGEAEVYPEGTDGEPVWVYCDMETDGGGWTVFQRRMDGSTDFFRGWKDYSKGFGHLSTEFWLGNDLLHALTSLTPMSLRIDLRSGNDTVYAHYSSFTVGSEENHYAIELFGYTGTAGDSMRYHNGRPFSTKDKDPRPLSIHCAKAYMGGWWYKNCYKANLNGLYATFSENQGVVWIDWKGKDTSLPFTEMKVRPVSLRPTVMKSQR
uniref:Tenascin XB n=1 Tax=Electrophorus electricus TaxID=8005 RepID=A0A4W4FUS4_ELEEL